MFASAAATNGTAAATNGLTLNSHQQPAPQQPGGHSFATGHQVNDIMMGHHHLTAGPHKLRV